MMYLSYSNVIILINIFGSNFNGFLKFYWSSMICFSWKIYILVIFCVFYDIYENDEYVL